LEILDQKLIGKNAKLTFSVKVLVKYDRPINFFKNIYEEKFIVSNYNEFSVEIPE
jgi:hypothetical protein